MGVFSRFWRWYNAHKTLNTGVAAGFFVWQLFHLYWLTAHVVSWKLFGVSFFTLTGVWEIFMALVDYTEIPAIILTSIVYINEFCEREKVRSLLYLFFLNSQWLHIFWITDEFVITQFTGAAAIMLPAWLSWCAIFIDYLELPVIYDMLKKFFVSLAKKQTHN